MLLLVFWHWSIQYCLETVSKRVVSMFGVTISATWKFTNRIHEVCQNFEKSIRPFSLHASIEWFCSNISVHIFVLISYLLTTFNSTTFFSWFNLIILIIYLSAVSQKLSNQIEHLGITSIRKVSHHFNHHLLVYFHSAALVQVQLAHQAIQSN